MGKTVAIIPARGGSKGIPKKNLKDFCGKPLLAWSIQQALNTPQMDEVYVSSDSKEILDVAIKYGAKGIQRPDELSGDKASSESALEHALETIGGCCERVVFLQPTSPLRKVQDLSKAIEQFYNDKLDSAFSGAVLEDFLTWKKTPEGTYQSLNYDYATRGRRQDRELEYVENGSFYIFKPEILTKYRNRLGGKIGIYLMDFWQSFELDKAEDWPLSEILFKNYLGKDYL